MIGTSLDKFCVAKLQKSKPGSGPVKKENLLPKPSAQRKMIPVSESIAIMRRSLSESTIRRQAEDWFTQTYVKFEQKPTERNYKRVTFEVGKVYSFGYFNPKYKKVLQFYNIFPISLCIGWTDTKAGTRNPLCVNLTFIPPAIRVKILDKIIQTFNSPLTANRMIVIKGKRTTKIVPLWYPVLKKILKKSGFEFAIRSYIVSRIKTKPLIVTYDDWWKTCVFTTKYVKKMNIRVIYYLYYKNVKPKYKPFEKVKINLTPRKLIK